MIGQNIGLGVPFLRFTDATMAVLMDTGNYKVNWANLKPLVYGHPESIDGNPIPGFAIDPPQYSFPSNYLIKYDGEDEKSDYTGFDFLHFGKPSDITSTSNIDCENDDFKQYCKANTKFYNPENKLFIRNNTLGDYQMLSIPYKVCETGKAMLPGYIYEENCHEYICNGYESLFMEIIVNNDKINTLTCNRWKKGMKFYYEQEHHRDDRYSYLHKRYFTCPDPERFCRTMKLSSMYFDKDPLDPNTKVLEGTPQPKPEWNFYYLDLENQSIIEKFIMLPSTILNNHIKEYFDKDPRILNT